jgi:UDP-N-acetylmuramoylalanine--D-glutamate ligase
MRTMSAPPATIDDLRGIRVVVLGLARSGAAAARMLADAGSQVTVYDRRPESDLADAVASLGGRHVSFELASPPEAMVELLDAADLVVTSPSISPRFPTTEPWLREALQRTIDAGTPLLSEIDLFLRLTRARVLAVTGTKGKTTTTSLIGAALAAAGVRHAVGGNIGTPLIERVGELTAADWAVLELSELQLPTISRGADVAVYTNIGSDHLDRHGTVEAYRAVKRRLAEMTVGQGTVVLNDDDAGCRELGVLLHGDVRRYGLEGGALDARLAGDWILLGEERLLAVADVPLQGRHMLSNVMAAALGARLAGAEPAAIADGIRSFRGVPHRMETVVERGGVRWVNDSQATIPMAAIASIEAFAPAPVILIAGGRGKGLDYADVADAAARHARAAILIGETAGELDVAIGGRIPVERAGGMDEAVRRAAALAAPGDVVLLSPAAASFDMFTDYAARGDAFRQAVAELGEEP